MRIIASGLVVVAVFAPQIARSTDDFSHIKAKVGQQVVVTEDGLSASGRVTDLSRHVDESRRSRNQARSRSEDRARQRQHAGARHAHRRSHRRWARGGRDADTHVGGAVVGGASGAFWGALLGAVTDRQDGHLRHDGSRRAGEGTAVPAASSFHDGGARLRAAARRARTARLRHRRRRHRQRHRHRREARHIERWRTRSTPAAGL